MSLALIPPERDPLMTRVDRDGFKAVASYMVGQALLGHREWGPVARATHDLPLTDPEALLLQHIVYTVGMKDHLPRIIQYVRFLQQTEGLTYCALWFAEAARDSVGVSGELLIELGTLYRKLCQFEQAEEAWRHLERMGREDWQVRAWIGLGQIARHRGNLGQAEAWFVQASSLAYQYTELRAMAVNNLGTVYDHMQPPRYEDAAIAYWDAFFLHSDPILKYGSLMNVGTAARGCQHYALADLCFRMVIAQSPCWADVSNALIERIEVCAALEDWEGVKDARTLLRFRLDNFTPDMKVDYHYRLGLLELRHGRTPAVEWNQAHWVASEHHLGEWIIRLEKLIASPLLELAAERREPVEVPRLQTMFIDAGLQCATAGV